jgi:hypothetical protein
MKTPAIALCGMLVLLILAACAPQPTAAVQQPASTAQKEDPFPKTGGGSGY